MTSKKSFLTWEKKNTINYLKLVKMIRKKDNFLLGY